MDFQLSGRFDQLNAQAGLPNEPRNVPCVTRHLPGPLGHTTAQRRPTFLHGRIFALLGLRGQIEITHEFESPMQTAKNRTAACPEHLGVWSASGTYLHVPQSAGRRFDFYGCFVRGGTSKFSTVFGTFRVGNGL